MKTIYRIPRYALALLFCSSFILLVGCGTTSPGKLGTPSGRPEVTIPNVNIQTVMDDVAAWLAAEGKPIVETGVYTITASFTKGNLWTPPYKSVFTIVQNGANVSLYEAMFNEQNNNELTAQPDYEDMQKQLTQIAEFIKTRSNPEITK